MSVNAEEAAAQFMALLDQVAEGEQITITRNGIPVAKFVSATEPKKLTSAEAVERLKEHRKGVRLNGLTIRELIDEGRKY